MSSKYGSCDGRNTGSATSKLSAVFVKLFQNGTGRGAARDGDALIVSFLHAHSHQFTARMQRRPQRLSRSQHVLAEEYVASHWDRDLRIEDIATAAGVSARSVFRMFKEAHGCSPFEYVRRLRLQKAGTLLVHGGGLSVTEVALKCGFQSLGHFARNYWQAFGERPSETIRRSRH